MDLDCIYFYIVWKTEYKIAKRKKLCKRRNCFYQLEQVNSGIETVLLVTWGSSDSAPSSQMLEQKKGSDLPRVK